MGLDIREAVEVLSALAPSLAEAMRTIRAKAFVILGRALLPIGRIAADTSVLLGKTQTLRAWVISWRADGPRPGRGVLRR
ncbi:hypothetical protein GCM10010433_50330 [Streptomyces pulveraceus]